VTGKFQLYDKYLFYKDIFLSVTSCSTASFDQGSGSGQTSHVKMTV